ncbi:MAG: peptidoglycan DD-metalloendopeptidase family protein [Hyphomicrobium sp.]
MLDEKHEQLDAVETRAKTLRDDVAGLDAEREQLNAQLVETAALIQRSEGQLTSIEGRLSELESQEKLVRGSLLQRHGQISQLLAALQRMGRNPPPVLITRREDALKMVRSAMLIAHAFPELKDQALALTERLDDLVRVMTDIRQEGERLRSETARLNEARSRLSGLMEAKKLSLADRQSELAAVRVATAEISKNVGDLAELIGKLDQTVSDKTGLGRYNAEVQHVPAPQTEAPVAVPQPPSSPAQVPVTGAVATLEPAAAAPPKSPATATAELAAASLSEPEKETQVAAMTPPPRLKPQIIEIAPSNSALVAANPGRIKPAIPFVSAHAKLPLPAQGHRVLAFGERTQYGANSKGIVIETRSGAQVTAPCDGWIVYAGEFRSYGQLLIINAGDGYHVLLAGMSQIDAQPGQFVLAAEPIGTMTGAAKSGQGAMQSNAPVLYVEFRKDGRPIDPDPWWVAGQQKVQG